MRGGQVGTRNNGPVAGCIGASSFESLKANDAVVNFGRWCRHLQLNTPHSCRIMRPQPGVAVLHTRNQPSPLQQTEAVRSNLSASRTRAERTGARPLGLAAAGGTAGHRRECWGHCGPHCPLGPLEGVRNCRNGSAALPAHPSGRDGASWSGTARLKWAWTVRHACHGRRGASVSAAGHRGGRQRHQARARGVSVGGRQPGRRCGARPGQHRGLDTPQAHQIPA